MSCHRRKVRLDYLIGKYADIATFYTYINPLPHNFTINILKQIFTIISGILSKPTIKKTSPWGASLYERLVF